MRRDCVVPAVCAALCVRGALRGALKAVPSGQWGRVGHWGYQDVFSDRNFWCGSRLRAG